MVYEWATAGGWRSAGAAAAPHRLLDEGRAMVDAVVRDAARWRGAALDVPVDAADAAAAAARFAAAADTPVRIIPVPPAADGEALRRATASCDWTLVVAPESDGLLAARVAAARGAGGRVAGCAAAFLAVAADKQATALALAAAGVPVPAGRALAGGEPMPAGFRLPAVRKARGGAGMEGFAVIRSSDDATAADGPWRLEAFAEGIPVGVSCLCGPAGIMPLEPMLQRFAPDTHRYEGGVSVGAAAWADRARALAVRAIEAVARTAHASAAGWVGVDMIVGAADDGRDDRVLEVNPRLTTSFVGLAAVHDESLLAAIVAAAGGGVSRPVRITGREVVFTAAGKVGVRDGGRDS